MPDLDELASRLEIQNVIAKYAHAVDRRDFDTVRSCYHDDAYDDHGRYKGGIDGLMNYMERLASVLHDTYHLMGTPYIVVKGDQAWAETFCIYRRHLKDDLPALAGLRYADTFERRAGDWRIARRLVILDWEHVAGDLPAKQSGPEWLRGALGDADPNHEMFHEAREATSS